MEKKKVIVLGMKEELEKIRENPQKFIREQEAIIIYCRDIASFNVLVKEINPFAVYYTGKAGYYYNTLSTTDHTKMRQYIKSKGIEKVVRLNIN